MASTTGIKGLTSSGCRVSISTIGTTTDLSSIAPIYTPFVPPADGTLVPLDFQLKLEVLTTYSTFLSDARNSVEIIGNNNQLHRVRPVLDVATGQMKATVSIAYPTAGSYSLVWKVKAIEVATGAAVFVIFAETVTV